MRLAIVITLTLCSMCPAASTTFPDAASLQGWSFSPGAEFPGADGSLNFDARTGHDERGSAQLRFDFSKGGNYVAAVCDELPVRNARLARLWLKKATGHRVAFRCVDSASQTFQKNLSYDFPDWQRIDVDLTHWDHAFGGPGDGQVRFPIRQFAILVENTHPQKAGVVWIDDVSYEATANTSTGTYTADDFKGDVFWWAGGDGNAIDKGRWRYEFRSGSSPTLNADVALLGRPQRLRIVLDSDGSGHELTLRLGSHFQNFERTLGRLDRGGRMVFEAVLNDSTGWRHFGGPNDGVWRQPLRLLQLRLVRRGSESAGRVHLHAIEVETDFDETSCVVIVPDVHQSNGQASFKLTLRNLRSDPAAGELVCDYRSLDGLIERRVERLELPGGGVPAHRDWTFPLAGRDVVYADWHWVEAGTAVPAVSIGLSTPIAGELDTELRPDSAIGVGLYLNRWKPDHRRSEKMRELANLARRAGVDWIREEFNWGQIEPRPGEYDWAFYDELVDVATSHGISIYGLLAYWSPFAEQNAPRGVEQYCDWVRKVVQRYQRRISHWEVWNEPNIFFWTGPRELYATLLTRAYETIKQVDPDATVLGCSTSGIDRGFIELTLKKMGRFDALTIHPYRGALDDLAYVAELQAVHELVGSRPVWITEIGFPSQLAAGYSEALQAALLTRTYAASLASGVVRHVAWYNFRNDGANPFDHEQNFGVVRSDFRLKPAYRALATVGTMLGGRSFAERIDIDGLGYAARFSGPDEDVIVLVSPGRSGIVTFDAGTRVDAFNTVGEPVDLVRVGNRYSVALHRSFAVYLKGRRGFDFEVLAPAMRVDVKASKVRAGQLVGIHVEPVAGVDAWELPYGWVPPLNVGAGRYELVVPVDATAGWATLAAHVSYGGEYRVPMAVEVVDSVIRR